MRKTAVIDKERSDEIKRLMLFDCLPEAIYLFLYRTLRDQPCFEDLAFRSLEEAESYCFTEFGIGPGSWEEIPDPLPGCQNDWIAPVRLRRDEAGRVIFGSFEERSGQSWLPFEIEERMSWED